MACTDSSPVLTDCTFLQNTADDGGGLFTGVGTPVLVNCEFIANSASDEGGGMRTNSGEPMLIDCIFNENSADDEGGGLYADNDFRSELILVNCKFFANSADRFGGGMRIDSGRPALANCRFIANSTNDAGGGIYLSYSDLMLTNCTLSANTATGSGGGLHSYNGSPNLKNCILWQNSAPNAPQIYKNYGSILVRYSCIEGGYAGTGNINSNPQFVRNPNPGQDGQWDGVDDDYGDLRLMAGSPCIDAGDNTAPGLAGILTDLDGNPRFLDDPATPDTGNGLAPIVDMGAYEFIPDFPGDFDDDGDVDRLDAIAFADCASGPAVPVAPDCEAMDLDEDGDADSNDFGILQRSYTDWRHPADFDGDGDVDSDDVAEFVDCETGSAVPVEPGCEDKDLDGDGDVDQFDFSILQQSLTE
jgi:hypothetical protein